MSPCGIADSVHPSWHGLWRGLRLRCPRCGERTFGAGIVSTHETCDSCGLVFEPGEGEFSMALMIHLFLMGMVALPAYLLLLFVFEDVPFGTGIAVLFSVLGVAYVLTYRHVKGAWFGWLYGQGERR